MSFFRTLPTKLSFNTSEKIQIANAELTSGDFALALSPLKSLTFLMAGNFIFPKQLILSPTQDIFWIPFY